MSKEAQKHEFFKAKADTLNATLQYLATRPYADVFKLIEGLSQSTPIDPIPAPEAKKMVKQLPKNKKV